MKAQPDRIKDLGKKGASLWDGRFLPCILAAALGASTAAAADVLVPGGAIWRYLDDGSDPGPAWPLAAFDDSAWPSGRAQLGYGDRDEATLLRSSTATGERYVTAYFRHAFTVADASAFAGLNLQLLRDDGAVVYLNDREVFRSNLPAGAVNYRTLASSTVGGAAESTFHQASLAAGLLVNGHNVLGVEVHQAATNSSDLSFDLSLSGVRPPIHFSLVSPPDGQTLTSSFATLEVSVSPPLNGSATATFFGRTATLPPGPDFTIVAIPDTQYYVSGKNGGTPATFIAQTDWIVAQRAARNIVFATQLGDCVENGDNGGNNVEWLAATNALYRLENPLTTLLSFGIPYGVAVGNHDQSPFGSAAGATTFYNQFFGEAHFAGRDYYGGHFGTDNDNHFQLFSASGLDFIVIHLEFDPVANPAVLSWADGLLQTHASRRAIVVTHWLINAGNPATFSAQGQAIYTALRTNANLFLMLGGHVNPEEGRRQDTFNGRTVHSLMSDYQSRPNGGNGWMRLLEFSPSNHVIRVRTYSPTLDLFETDADSEFDLPYDMRTGPPFTAVATGAPGASGTGAQAWAAAWSGLPERSRCEWFVALTEDGRVSTSPVWHFVTAPRPTGPPVAVSVNIRFDPATRRVTLTWPSRADATYRVVGRDSVADPNWMDLSPDLPSAGAITAWSEDLSSSITSRIYAVRSWP